jgi:hypothetical protein
VETGREVLRVDHVVDVDWRLVRFRWSELGGMEVEATGSNGDVEVSIEGPTETRQELVAGVVAVWSASPSSLLVVDRLLRTSALAEVPAVLLEPPFEPRPVAVRVMPVGSGGISTGSGASTTREVEVGVDGRRIKALLRSDLPLGADGWFELAG